MAPEQLISAIRAALDETERIAREATAGEWRLGVMFGTVFADGGNVARDCYEQDAVHIAHNDPAAVLLSVEADWELLTAYEAARAGRLPEHGLWVAVRIRARGLGINPETETPQ